MLTFFSVYSPNLLKSAVFFQFLPFFEQRAEEIEQKYQKRYIAEFILR